MKFRISLFKANKQTKQQQQQQRTKQQQQKSQQIQQKVELEMESCHANRNPNTEAKDQQELV